jgi:hypothetical protein
MKRGNLRVAYDPDNRQWAIQGRKINGAWYNSFDEDRKKLNQSADLLFDLKYDACCWLQGFIDYHQEQRPVKQAISAMQQTKKKSKKKIVKKSKRINRKKR